MKTGINHDEIMQIVQELKTNEQLKAITKDLDLSFAGWVVWILGNWDTIKRIISEPHTT